MYFKKLELQGFKSFAEPVTIDFNRGITCIVGPNGSGKSNISDAIRWVLGEQSPKTLRGGKMEDVIFAGTASRKSRGMAEATLTIDNSDHVLDIDYNEVAITRRVFRSGESEYRINKVPCRLKDIRELIMDTGIGVDGYSIIGQGRIADIVSNKPETRRELFEEAAGIVKYRTKKEESERKLDSAKNNMESVNAVINEIEGRIDTLREDSVKAKEYLELKERYKAIEINVVLKNIESIELKNEFIKDEITEAGFDIDTFAEEKKAVDASVAEARSRSAELERIGSETQEKLVRKIEEINDIAARSTREQERILQIDRDKERIALEKEGLKAKIAKEEANREALLENRKAIDAEIEVFEADLAAKKEALAELQSTVAGNAKKADDARNRAFELRAGASKQAESLRLRIGQLTARRNVIREMEQAYAGYNYAVRFLMKQNIGGIVGVAGELITVPRGLELALETALGASVQNIVTTDSATAERAISLLKQNRAGRLTFLPLSDIRPSVPDFEERIRRMAGVKGFATELVRFDEANRPAIDYLLGRVIVVDELQNAVRMAREVRTGFRFVTLEGDLVTAQGAMTGGSSKNTVAGLLERKAEGDKLDAEIKKLEKELEEGTRDARKAAEDAERIAQRLAEQSEDQRGDIDARNEAYTEALLKLNSRRNNRSGIDDLITRVDEAVREIEADLARKAAEEDALEAEKNELKGGSGGLIEGLERAKQERADLETLAEESREERLAILKTLEEAEHRKNEIDGRYLDAQNRKFEAENRLARNETLLETYKSRLWEDFEVSYIQAVEFRKKDFVMSQAQKESRQIRDRMKELGDVNVGAIREYETVSERYSFLTEQRKDLENAMDALIQIIQEMDKNIRRDFKESFEAISRNFSLAFTELFGGGTAELRLEDETKPLECGIEIVAQPPGKRLQNMSLLSGGEKTMTAIALMFAILKTKPTPFCILDEVEAALDDMNIEQFATYLRSGFRGIQFALITHQKRTMEHADVLYGITMPERGISKVISLKLGDEFDLE
jgi:chromosome segregation protein